MSKPKKEYTDYKKFCKHQLQPNEHVQTWGTGYIGEMMGSVENRQYNGCLVVTSTRVVFYSKGWFSEIFEEIPMAKISSVESKKIIGHTTLSIHTSGNSLKFKSLIPEEAKFIQDEINELKSKIGESVAGNKANDPIQDLERLAILKEKGIINEEEFQTKKLELLKRVA